MTTHPLNDLTPELIRELEQCFISDDDAHAIYLVMKHHDLILECMKTALRLKNDLDKMERNE